METPLTAYEKALADVAKLRESIERLNPHCDVIEEIKRSFPDLNITTSVGFQFGQIQGALLHVNELTDMNQVIPVAKMLTAKGYHTKGFEDYPEMRRRTYDYGEIKLMCFLTWKSGAKCQWVEVGKKEVPEYKLMRDEGTVIE